MASVVEDWLAFVDPFLVMTLVYVVVIINTTLRTYKTFNVFYTLYTWNAVSLFFYHVAMYCKLYAMRNQFIDQYPTMAEILIYTQIGSFFSIAIGTIFITVNQYCALGDPMRYITIWRPRNVNILLVIQHVLGYGHCLPLLFSGVSFLPLGKIKFIAFTEDIDILVNFASIGISGVVAIVCTPTVIASWYMLRVKKNYPQAERHMVYTCMVLFSVHLFCGIDKMLLYLAKREPFRFFASIALTSLHYFMDLHLVFTIAMPIISHKSLRKKLTSIPLKIWKRLKNCELRRKGVIQVVPI